MPGRLIAWAWLAEKGLRHALGPWTERHWLLFSSEPDWGPWKERFYPSVLYPCLTKGLMHWDGLCHQRDSVNSSEQSSSSPPLFPHSCSPSPFSPFLTQNPVWKKEEDIPNGRPVGWHYEFDFRRKGQSYRPLQSFSNNSHETCATCYICSSVYGPSPPTPPHWSLQYATDLFQMIRMCVHVRLCVWEKLDLLFEPCVACQLVRAASCILLHILADWIGVVGPPVVLVIAQACGSGESLEKGQSGRKKTQCHLYATSLSHTIPAEPSASRTTPVSWRGQWERLTAPAARPPALPLSACVGCVYARVTVSVHVVERQRG